MRYLILVTLTLLALGCGKAPAIPTTDIPPVKATAPTSAPVLVPIATWVGAQAVPWSSSLENTQFTMVVKYDAVATAPNSRLAELGGYDSPIGGGFGIETNANGGQLSCVLWTRQATVAGRVDVTPPASGTHTVACAYQGQTLSMFLDGVFIDEVAATYVANGSQDLGVGQGSTGFYNYSGTIFSASYFDKALTTSELAGL